MPGNGVRDCPRESNGRWKKSIKSDQTSCLSRASPPMCMDGRPGGYRAGLGPFFGHPNWAPSKARDKTSRFLWRGKLRCSWPNPKGPVGLEGTKWGLDGSGAEVPLASPPNFRHFRSCQGPDGSEGGRAGGLVLRSEVLFSRGRGEREAWTTPSSWKGSLVREGLESQSPAPGEVRGG